MEPRNFSVRSEIAHWVDGYGERAVEGDTYPLILPDTANQTIVQYAVPDEGFYAVSFEKRHVHFELFQGTLALFASIALRL